MPASTFSSPVARVLIVGAGSIGERHLRCFGATGRVKAAFVEPRAELREQIAAKYPASVASESIDSALNGRWDAAVIATPAPLHVPQAIQLARRGIHLLIEKPLSVSLDRIDELTQATAEHGITVAVAYVYRTHPALAAMREVIHSGRFGRPVELVAVSGQNFPHYRPAYRQTYYANRAMGGGAVQDALTHVLNAGEWLAGPIDRVVSDASHQLLDGVEVEDTAHVLARQGNVMSSYSLNQHQAPNELTITVICERGTARFEYHRHRWMWMEKPDDPWHEEPIATLERDTLFTSQANSFLDAIEGKSPPLCTLVEGIQTLKVNLAVLSSADRRAWQEIK